MIFVDSNVWIFSEMAEYPEHKVAAEKLAKCMKDGVFINTIIISEVFHKLYRLIGVEESMRRTKNILSSRNVIYLTIERETVEKAFERTKNLRINDAIIAQHVLDSKSELLTDDVKDFKKVAGLKVTKLR